MGKNKGENQTTGGNPNHAPQEVFQFCCIFLLLWFPLNILINFFSPLISHYVIVSFVQKQGKGQAKAGKNNNNSSNKGGNGKTSGGGGAKKGTNE